MATAFLLGLTGCAVEPQPVVLQGEGLGSSWIVKLAAPAPPGTASMHDEIQARVDEVARNLSRWDSSSRLSEINNASTSDWQPVSPVLAKPLSYALALAADTAGAYDPTVAPLVDAWGFGTAGRRYEPPSPMIVSAARARVGYARVSLDAQAHQVRKPAGMQIDLSSMTHGYAADQVSEYLDGIGIRNYLVDVGSEIRARGESPDGGAWHVAIERPPPETSEVPAGAGAGEHASHPASTTASHETPKSASPAAPESAQRVISLRDAGIATSGNFRYFFDYNGRRYSHRIDPRTGEPVEHDLASVTVIDPECMHADALATALTVLGPDEGMKFATDRNIAALFIVRSGDKLVEKMTPRFTAYLN